MTGNDNLKQKMIICTIVAVMIPFIITGIIIYIQLSDNLMKLAKEKSLRMSIDISQLIDNFIDSNLRFVQSFAMNPDIVLALKTGNYQTVECQLTSIYQGILKDKTNIILTDKDGIVQVDSRFPEKRGLNLSDRQYFIKAQNGLANVSDSIFARKNRDGKTIIAICAPIFEDKVFMGSCIMIFTTEYIFDIISKKIAGESGYAYLLNKKGVVLVHPNPDYVLKTIQTELPATDVALEMPDTDQPGVASYTFTGKKKIAGISQVKHTGWITAYAQTKDEIMAPVNRILNYVFISGVIFVVITIVIIVFISHKISSPIQQMMDTVSQAARYSTEVVVQIGLDRKISYANPAFEKITGVKVQDVIGTVPSFENTGRIPSQTIWQELETGNTWSGQLEFRAEASKKTITIDVLISPVRDRNGWVRVYLVMGRDVTDKLMFEKRMNRTQKLESIGTLAGGIAHDFNNILSIIFGYAELALHGSDNNPHIQKNIRQIIIASERARELVTQILSFSRHEEVKLLSVKLGTIVREALKLLRASTPSFITIDSDIASTACVFAEPTQIHQVVMNLFTNAVHAIGENPGTITLILQDFMVDQEFIKTHPGINEGKHLILRIKDTGCGMSGETIEHIFDPFFTTKPKKKGTGLGLSVVHGIVKKMNGIITVYSHPGQGTIFNVILPAINKDVSDFEELNTSIKNGTERIALVDDEKDVAVAVQSILTNLGYQVTSFTDSGQALSEILSGPDNFDLIITDYTMPDLTGLDMINKLRTAGILIPAILMSGFIGKNIEVLAKQARIAQLLYKPANTYQLAKSIRKALEDSTCGI
ncbi:ATP-binding protein [uncultured Desulfobacter sp.]|uniref:ATP-binding protein n=1 Tax=uncultured Desulfobacter sp. TaxID=240139 RepID=UPI002AAAB3B0|nr:ATP-binding protein [uncultured Desulfobacter sp.]